MSEKFPHTPDEYPRDIVVPNVFPEPTGRHEDERKPSIVDIQRVLEIIEEEENGIVHDDPDHGHTIH